MLIFTIAWICLVALLLWVGNTFITKALNQYLSWRAFGNIRFFVHLLVGLMYLLLVLNASYISLKLWLTEDPPTYAQIVVMNVYGAAIFVPVFSVYFSLQFLRNWRVSALQSEKFQKESIRSQLEALKSHLDPHFLFNNLNILSSLIETDPKRSSKFLDHFSEVYRLILKSKSEDLIPLSEELSFIQSYIFLIETRFSDAIKFKISIPDYLHHWLVPPLVLQMLVENAIKHNLITEKKPLKIVISTIDDMLLVCNSLNAKPINPKPDKSSGLQNIKNRYQHYTQKPIKVEKSIGDYAVTIPLIDPASV